MLALCLIAAIASDYDRLIAFDETKVAPGVIAFTQHRTDSAVVSGNTVVVIGDEGVLVVDTGHFPEATRRIIQRIRALTPRPVRWVVNTHWHSDHIHGNRLYKEAFPGVTIVATDSTRRNFDHPLVKDELGQMNQQAAEVKALLARGVGSSGRPLTDQQKSYFAGALHELELYAPDLQSSSPLPPDLTFTDRLVLHLGGREAQLLFLGRGNTGGDTVVYLPDVKVLATGDLVVYPIPYAFGSFFSEWGSTLRRAMALGATTFIPGHGPVMHDASYLQLVAEATDAVAQRVGELARQGLSLDEVRQKLDLGAVRAKLAHGDDDLGRRFDGLFLGPGVPRAYREAKEGPLQDES